MSKHLGTRKAGKGELTPAEREAKEIELATHGVWIDPKSPSAPTEKVPLNFLLSCSDRSLGQFELTRLAAVANLRKELHAILDKLIDEMAQAGLAAWFRGIDRNALRHAIENPPDVGAWAKAEIRRREGRSEGGQGELPSPSVFRPSLPPGAAHLAAGVRYQERNIAEGKCRYCPKPLDRNSVDMCTEHLKQARERMRAKRNPNKPPHGRAPGTLKALAEANQKRQLEASLTIPAASKEELTDLRFKRRKMQAGECEQCSRPIVPGHQHCADHLERFRERHKGKKLQKYLEGERTGKGGKTQRKNAALLKLMKGEESIEE